MPKTKILHYIIHDIHTFHAKTMQCDQQIPCNYMN